MATIYKKMVISAENRHIANKLTDLLAQRKEVYPKLIEKNDDYRHFCNFAFISVEAAIAHLLKEREAKLSIRHSILYLKSQAEAYPPVSEWKTLLDKAINALVKQEQDIWIENQMKS